MLSENTNENSTESSTWIEDSNVTGQSPDETSPTLELEEEREEEQEEDDDEEEAEEEKLEADIPKDVQINTEEQIDSAHPSEDTTDVNEQQDEAEVSTAQESEQADETINEQVSSNDDPNITESFNTDGLPTQIEQQSAEETKDDQSQQEGSDEDLLSDSIDQSENRTQAAPEESLQEEQELNEDSEELSRPPESNNSEISGLDVESSTQPQDNAEDPESSTINDGDESLVIPSLQTGEENAGQEDYIQPNEAEDMDSISGFNMENPGKGFQDDEEEELRNVQEDDPSFEADYNVDEYDKSNDDFDASFLVDENEDRNNEPNSEDTQLTSNIQDIEMTDANKATDEPKDQAVSEDTKMIDAKKATDESSKEVQSNELEQSTEQESKETADAEKKPTDIKESDSSQKDEVVKSEVPPEQPKEQEDEDEEEEEDEEEVEEEETTEEKPAYTKQTHLIVIPSYASWFNMKKIHKIERDSLPEFFDTNHPSKSPKIYVNYRNFMINSYRLNPNEFLTLTSCRRNLVGDVGTLMRIHRFLNKWGLINYQVSPQFKPGYAIEKMPNGQSVDLPYTGDYHVKYDSPRGLFPFDTSRIPPDRIDVNNLKKLLGTSNGGGVGASAGSVVDQNGNKHGLESGETSEPQSKRQKIDDGWTQDEYNTLINSVKVHKNDWYKIADSVGNNKTAQECILKFLRLPLEDKFNPVNDEASIKLLKYAPNYPVSSIDNPVLANLAFMTKLVDSDVAKAASEAASKAIEADITKKVNEVYNNNKSEVKSEEEQQAQPEQNGSTEREAGLKDAIGATFGIVGARSHLFSSYEEREMHKISSTIINHSLSKIDVKLGKIDELEKIYERERKHLAKQQEEVLLDRLALTKSTINIIKKLDNAIQLVEQGANNNNVDKSNIGNILSEVKSLLYKPTRQGLATSTLSTSEEQNPIKEEASTTAFQEDEYKPLSLKSPQNFKIWAP
ncbi:SWI/SNF complex subunit SWI3 [Spathaspora sp. JA1]|nr:SWI/SNF complex subunit SWI3 [Spathaspora sp. JA1]